MSNIIALSEAKKSILMRTPITQDASASAYQILSYFLLDVQLARMTNLIPSPDEKIQDIYSFFLEEFKGHLMEEVDKGLLDISLVKSVAVLLNRKIVKSFFMPVVYGKRVKSYADDLFAAFSHYLTKKDCMHISAACFRFWSQKFASMNSLIELIRSIGKIMSLANRPVIYSVPYYSTVQDYIKMKTVKVSVYTVNKKDNKDKRLRRLSLRIPSSERDSVKTKTATFANFFHQKDANIAMKVVNDILGINAPIYTVHDNFIITAEYSRLEPLIYSNAISELGPPNKRVNKYIYDNVINPIPVKTKTSDEFCNSKVETDLLRTCLRLYFPTIKSAN